MMTKCACICIQWWSVLIAAQVDSGLGEGGVIGVIPHDLMPREMSGAPIGDLRVVDTMHHRKVQKLNPALLHACQNAVPCCMPWTHSCLLFMCTMLQTQACLHCISDLELEL